MTTTWRSPDAGFGERRARNTYIIPKDVIQVPNKGYVVIRVHLDNPGTFLFHCHIDTHLRLGMALVMQVGEFSDWNIKNTNNATLSSRNIECKEIPPDPFK